MRKFDIIFSCLLLFVAVFVFVFPQLFVFPDVGEYVVERQDLTLDLFYEMDRINQSELVVSSREIAVIMIEFTDFECPFCREAQDDLSQFREHSNIQYLHRHFPVESIHPDAVEAAHIYECAAKVGQEELARELLFAESLTEERFTEILDTLGIPLCLSHNAILEQDRGLANFFGVQGTPTFVIIPVANPQSYTVVEGADILLMQELINSYLD